MVADEWAVTGGAILVPDALGATMSVSSPPTARPCGAKSRDDLREREDAGTPRPPGLRTGGRPLPALPHHTQLVRILDKRAKSTTSVVQSEVSRLNRIPHTEERSTDA